MDEKEFEGLESILEKEKEETKRFRTENKALEKKLAKWSRKLRKFDQSFTAIYSQNDKKISEYEYKRSYSEKKEIKKEIINPIKSIDPKTNKIKAFSMENLLNFGITKITK